MKQTTGREIKFRVFDKNIPKHEGELKKPTGKMVEWDYVKWSSYFNDGLSGRLPIMQYTGLKDKNGKDIYEGDICSGHSDGNGKIVWTNYDGGYDYEFDDGNIVGINEVLEEIQVIGNIYENKNLLP